MSHSTSLAAEQTPLSFRQIAGAGIMAAPWIFGYHQQLGRWSKLLHLLGGGTVLFSSLLPPRASNISQNQKPLQKAAERSEAPIFQMSREDTYQFGADGADFFDCAL